MVVQRGGRNDTKAEIDGLAVDPFNCSISDEAVLNQLRSRNKLVTWSDWINSFAVRVGGVMPEIKVGCGEKEGKQGAWRIGGGDGQRMETASGSDGTKSWQLWSKVKVGKCITMVNFIPNKGRGFYFSEFSEKRKALLGEGKGRVTMIVGKRSLTPQRNHCTDKPKETS